MRALDIFIQPNSLDGLSLATLQGAYNGARADMALFSERDETNVSIDG